MKIIEGGKTFWQDSEGFLTRCHDENFYGMRFRHKRCPFCQKITSVHPNHWLNHLEKCAPDEYSNSALLRLRYVPKEEIAKHEKFGRK